MHNRPARITVAAACLIGLAACTTTAAGNPIPDQVNSTAPSTSTTQPSDEDPPTDDELPSNGAPKVENPIDATHFEQNPCDALTATQAGTLNVDPKGSPADMEFGKGCVWRNPESGGTTGISFISDIGGGLSATYAENDAGYYRYFEPIDDLEGFPAAIFDTGTATPTAKCSIAVGLTDDLSIQTLTLLSTANIGSKDPCEVAKLATGEMLKTMKARS